MQNSYVIASLAKALIKTGESIDMMVCNTNEADQQTPELSEVYESMILDELAHAQMIVLNLTRMLTYGGEGSVDFNRTDEGSVFGPGELDDKKSKI